MSVKLLSACVISIGLVHSTPVFADIPLGVQAIEARQFDQAIAAFSSDLEKVETGFEAHWRTGQAYVMKGEPKAALDFLEKAIELNPNHAEAQYWWGAANGSVAEKASIFSAAGYAKACRKGFEKAVELDPSHLAAHEGLISYYLQAPGFMGGDKDKALVLAKHVQTFNRAAGYNQLVKVYTAHKDTAAVSATYDMGLKEFPANADLRLGRGFLAREKKEFEAAAEDFRYLANYPLSDDVDEKTHAHFVGLGRYFFGAVASVSGSSAYLEEGQKALETYLKAENFDFDLRKSYAQYYLATLYLKEGNKEEAKTLVQAARNGETNKDLRKKLKALKKKLK